MATKSNIDYTLSQLMVTAAAPMLWAYTNWALCAKPLLLNQS
jgi:hypothetical protein